MRPAAGGLLVIALLAGVPCKAEPVRFAVRAGEPARLIDLETGALVAPAGRMVDVEWSLQTEATQSAGLDVQLVEPHGENRFAPSDGVIVPGSTLALRVRATRCCAGSDVTGSVTYRAGTATLGTSVVALRVEPSLRRCLAPWLGLLGGGLLAFLLSNSFARSRFLPPPRVLADKFDALCWDKQRIGWVTDRSASRDLVAPLQRALQPHHRFLNWLRSNPLALLWPGNLYREALELQLGISPWARLVPERDVERRLQADPASAVGSFFLTTGSNGDLGFAAVIDEDRRIHPQLTLEGVPRPRGAARLVYPRAGHTLIRTPPAGGELSQAWRIAR